MPIRRIITLIFSITVSPSKPLTRALTKAYVGRKSPSIKHKSKPSKAKRAWWPAITNPPIPRAPVTPGFSDETPYGAATPLIAYGDYALTNRALDFFIHRQRADGKIMHEYSQAADSIDWKATPYFYASADSTPLLLMAAADYARKSGDQELHQNKLGCFQEGILFHARARSQQRHLFQFRRNRLGGIVADGHAARGIISGSAR